MRAVADRVRSNGLCFFANLAIILVLAFLCSSRYLADGRVDIPKLLAVSLLSAALVYLLFRAGPKPNRIACLTSLMVLVALELMLRLVIRDPNSGQDAVRVPRPYTMFGGQPDAEFPDRALMTAPGEQREPIRLNHLGFRFERAPAKPRGEGVFVLGSSTVFDGTGPGIPCPSLERRFPGMVLPTFNCTLGLSVLSPAGLPTPLHFNYRPDVVLYRRNA
jgi:hypothetical protein